MSVYFYKYLWSFTEKTREEKSLVLIKNQRAARAGEMLRINMKYVFGPSKGAFNEFTVKDETEYYLRSFWKRYLILSLIYTCYEIFRVIYFGVFVYPNRARITANFSTEIHNWAQVK